MSGGGSAKETESSKLMAQYMKQSQAAEGIQAGIGEEQWQRYQNAFVPLENQEIQRATTTQADRNSVTGMANADLAQQAGSFTPTMTALGAGGAAPSSGKALAAITQAANNYGKALAQSTNKASFNADQLEFQRLQQLVNEGRGQANEAQLGLTSLANQAPGLENTVAMNNLYNTEVGNANSSDMAQGIGAAGGVGLNYLTQGSF